MKTISWQSLLSIGIALLLWGVIKFTLEPTEGINDCVLTAHIVGRIEGIETFSVVYLPEAGPFHSGGYHFTEAEPTQEIVKATVTGYRVEGDVPPVHYAIIWLQNATAKYAVDNSGI